MLWAPDWATGRASATPTRAAAHANAAVARRARGREGLCGACSPISSSPTGLADGLAPVGWRYAGAAIRPWRHRVDAARGSPVSPAAPENSAELGAES